eukprot:TRINITY_DN50144_c0_g1_i1.p1 TRINITY_DN50144_c0_g1~~TRINITY_DN50144_c0_g1_i1.p1  ORF type:complete len:422 (-),score=27.05 TRINITY_DN50144_c0_g1_i1:113-1300(-)
MGESNHLYAVRASSSKSAPAAISSRQCLVRGTRVLVLREGRIIPIEATSLDPRDVLVSGSGTARIKVVTLLRFQERDVSDIVIELEDPRFNVLRRIFTLTSNHALNVRSLKGSKFDTCPAHDLRKGDSLRTYSTIANAKVVENHSNVRCTEVIEIELEDSAKTMYVEAVPALGSQLAHVVVASDGIHNSDPNPHNNVFVEVFGELAPPSRDEYVKLLRFNRFDKFREALLESAELKPCRDALTSIGVSCNLGDTGSLGRGAGMPFVQAEFAAQVISTLARTFSKGLLARDIIVSHAFEYSVLEAIRRRENVRPTFLREERNVLRPFDISRTTSSWLSKFKLFLAADAGDYVMIERTFLHVRHVDDFEITSAVTQSTTDGHLAHHKNPRCFRKRKC